MSKHKSGRKGWTRKIEQDVINAELYCNGQMLDFAWKQSHGKCRSIRACAELAINDLLKSERGLPVPNIETLDQPTLLAIPVVEKE